MLWPTKRVYLDAAAGVTGNPSSPHEEGRRSREQLEDARKQIAKIIEVQPDDVIFTSGATESNALAILGVVRAAAAGRGAGLPPLHALYLPSAHASIVENMKLLEREGVMIEALPIRDCRVDTEALAKMLKQETVLVAMDAVCGETGVVWNTRAVAEVLCGHRMSTAAVDIRCPQAQRVLLHVDASQAPLTEKISREHFGADTLTLDGAKVGPRGIGVLIAHRTIPLMPLYAGGGQERGVRPGSGAPELAREFAAALRAAAQGAPAFRAAAERRRVELVADLVVIPDLIVNEGRAQVPNILNLSLPGRDTDYLVALLDEAGFATATRSACETDSEIGSRAIMALTGDSARARATLRVSWGSETRPRDLARFAKALTCAVGFIDSVDKR